jgi:N-acetylglucosamine malate deacetylase 1
VDITPYWTRRQEALACFGSQFHDPRSTEPESPIANPDFMPFLEGRHRQLGRLIGSTYAEGFTASRPPGVDDLMALR